MSEPTIPGSQTSGGTALLEKPEEVKDAGWKVILFNDPVNLVPYVVATLQQVLEVDKAKAMSLTKAVEANGKASVFRGGKDKCTEIATALGTASLWAQIERQGSGEGNDA